MPETDGQGRLDRIEAILETLANRQANLEDEHRRLLRAQVVMTDSMQELLNAQQRAAETQREFSESLRQLAESQTQVVQSQTQVVQSQAQLAQSQAQLAESQRHTDERLNALIAIVDELIRRRPPS